MNLYFNGQRSAFRQDLSLGADGNSIWTASDDPIVCTQESALEVTPRVKIVKFGEYEQRAMDGINAIPNVFSLNFKLLPEAKARALDKFLRGGDGPYQRTPDQFFYYTPVVFTHLGQGKYVCDSHRATFRSGNHVTMVATFREVFDYGEQFDFS